MGAEFVFGGLGNELTYCISVCPDENPPLLHSIVRLREGGRVIDVFLLTVSTQIYSLKNPVQVIMKQI